MNGKLDLPVERVQVGVRLEKRMVQVLKGLAEFEGLSLGQLLEKIVLHTFEPIEDSIGEACVSPFSEEALVALEHLRKVYGMDYRLDALSEPDSQE